MVQSVHPVDPAWVSQCISLKIYSQHHVQPCISLCLIVMETRGAIGLVIVLGESLSPNHLARVYEKKSHN
jgi:hypothetical protein